MTYTPINWQTGDTITADKLNKMDNGWGVGTSQLFSETVITEETEEGNWAEMMAPVFISQETAIITFDGVDYTCTNIGSDEDIHAYGAPWSDSLGSYDFSVYPFRLNSYKSASASLSDSNDIYTATDGEHAVSVNADVMDTSESFDKAVNLAVNPFLFKVQKLSTTWQEVYDAIESGKVAYWTEKFINGIELYIVSYVESPSVGVYIVGAICYTYDNAVKYVKMATATADGVLIPAN